MKSSFAICILDFFNGFSIEESLWNTKKFIHKKCGIPYPKLDSLFELDLNKLPQVTKRSLTTKTRLNEVEFVMQYSYTDSSTDDVSLGLPKTKALALLRDHTDQEVMNLIERYNFFSPQLGFFWSIHPEVYQVLSQKPENCLEVIEGFASPLNNNLELYCSAFETDKNFGSIGDFFDTIQNRGESREESKYRRWIINPPYTNSIFEKVLSAVKARLNDFPDDEFYFLLPSWESVSLIDEIMQRGYLRKLPGFKYRLFDHISEASISPPIDMLIGVLKGKPVASCPLVDEAYQKCLIYRDSPDNS